MAYLGLLLHKTAIKVLAGTLLPSSRGHWQDSGSCGLVD